ncbi:MAG TPA: tetratricopeptide repeat protein [Xanthobacteraceae bacterium]|nr:tetratricopeptide repeat protein [Xanthobacteraceae bacterium]
MTLPAGETFQRALAAMQAGNHEAAERLFKQTVESQPEHIPALSVFSGFLARQGRRKEAERYMRLALAAYDRTLQRTPNLAEAWLGRGQVLTELGRGAEAVASYDRAIANKPELTHVHLMRAKLLVDLGRHEQALEGVDRLLVTAPNLAEGWLGRGNILFELRRYDEALAAYDRSAAAKTALPEAWLGRGNALNALKRYEDALAAYDKALGQNPKLAGAWLGRGNTFDELKRYDDALAAYDKALGLAPNLAEAWLGRGNLLSKLNRFDEASSAFDRASAIIPDFPEAWLGCGNVFFALKRYDDALSAYDKALTLRPSFVEAQLGRGNILAVLKRHREAADAYAAVLQIMPQHPFTKGLLLHQKMLACEWSATDALIRDIERDIAEGTPSAEPFGWQGVAKSPRSLQLCAEIYSRERYPANVKTFQPRPSAAHQKIRVGYLSGEFREQATSHLIVGLLEQHDPSRFEIYGFDNGWDDRSKIRARIGAALHKMVDIRPLGDAAALAAIRQCEIDILVNLNGYFGEHRTQLFAQRAAPIQVNYLGFPGTLGASYMDYIVADRWIIPENHKSFYQEKVVYLPESYQANDRKREIAVRTPARAESGLPETGFVFCCFNNSYKILPEVFDRWMRILSRIGGSVLWLFGDDRETAANLTKEAAARNVNPERLVFAKRVPPAEHLARHRLADLFLDTLPYNAHTTGSDALWAGLPVLTCLGETFAGRVGASLLHAIRLPELVAPDLDAYEETAIGLAGDRGKLTTIARKLADHRLTTPLFDTALFASGIEKAYSTMHERLQAGLSADHIYVSG